MRWYLAYSRADPFLALGAIALALGGAWAACLVMGGSRTPGPHLFYVAIALAAVRFTWPAAVVTACAAGLLAGPLLPADVSAQLAQQPSSWLLRMGIFTAIGVFIALLVRTPEITLRSRLGDAVASARLLRALKNGDIEVVYQPIYRLSDAPDDTGDTGDTAHHGDELVAVEALARWRRSPDRYASAASFIPMAERTGAITRLDEYVLGRAVATARGWTAVAPSLAISVNLSATTLMQTGIVATIARVLRDEGFPPGRLQLELTESALIHDVPAAIQQVEALHALGIRVAIDDFGSGQASLNYLQHFPVDVVKLDRSIVTAATLDDRSRCLLRGVLQLCDLLSLAVVAEGVEFDDQLALLREVGVPMVQGFLLGNPTTADAIDAILGGSTQVR